MSKRARLAVIVVVASVVVGSAVFGNVYVRTRADAAIERDEAALNRAVEGTSYAEAEEAWLAHQLDGDTARLDALVPVRDMEWIAATKEGDVIRLVYKSGFGPEETCLDVKLGPEGNEVTRRAC